MTGFAEFVTLAYAVAKFVHGDAAQRLEASKETLLASNSLKQKLAPEVSSDPLTISTNAILTAFGIAYRRYWCRDWSLLGRESLRRPDSTLRSMRLSLEEHIHYVETMWNKHIKEGGYSLDIEGANPLAHGLYQRLWSAFSQPFGETGEALLPIEAKHKFEALYLAAHFEVLRAPQWMQWETARKLDKLDLDHRSKLKLMRIYTGFAALDVFHRVRSDRTLALLPLSDLYVEPNVRRIKAKQHPTGESDIPDAGPILSQFECWLNGAPRVLVVDAHFGFGKSLSAMTIAANMAANYLSASSPSSEVWFPVLIRCGDHYNRTDLMAGWRSAIQGALENFFAASGYDEIPFPAKSDRVLFIFDGLDEVVETDRGFEDFFRMLAENTSDRWRFAVFSRPAAIPESVVQHRRVVTLQIEPFTDPQITQWLHNWYSLTEVSRVRDDLPADTADGKPTRCLTLDDFKSPERHELARTPILLLMLAHTAELEAARDSELFEAFLREMARGKYLRDPHRAHSVDAAGEYVSQVHSDLDEYIEVDTPAEVEAMLRLMSRVAWKSLCLEFGGSPDWNWTPRPLRKSDLPAIVQELNLKDADAERVVQRGVLLVLQAELGGDLSNARILFGHKSFRDYLVARFWDSRLHALAAVQDQSRRWERASSHVEPLLQGRLLTKNDSFRLLLERLENWTPEERSLAMRWAHSCFSDLEPARDAMMMSEDSRYPLREAALAIGCALASKDGKRFDVSDPKALSTLYAWYLVNWRHTEGLSLVAPNMTITNLSLPGAWLKGADLSKAHFELADLRHANLNDSSLVGAVVKSADLRNACLRCDLRGVTFVETNLEGADFTGAHLEGARFQNSSVIGANFYQARLIGCAFQTCKLSKARFEAANLCGATFALSRLQDVDFSEARLHRASLTDALEVDSVSLRGAQYDQAFIDTAPSLDPASLEMKRSRIDILDDKELESLFRQHPHP